MTDGDITTESERTLSGENHYALEEHSKTKPIYDASYVLKFRNPSYIATLKKLNLVIDAITELQIAVSKLNNEVNRLEENQTALRIFSKMVANDINDLQQSVGLSETNYSMVDNYVNRGSETFP